MVAGADLSSLAAQPSHPSSLGIEFFFSTVWVRLVEGIPRTKHSLSPPLPGLCPLQPPPQSQVETHLFFQLI